MIIFSGSDPGPFFLARYGLYIRPADTWVLFLAFRGNDVHGETSPVANKTTMSAWLEDLSPFYDKAGSVNRAVYVHYSGAVPCTRIAPTLVTPSVMFGNTSSAVDYKSQYQTLSGHGLGVFGSKASLANHLGREAIFAFHNTLQLSGIHLNMDLGDLMAHMTFEDDQDETKALLPPLFDPVKDYNVITLHRTWYWWFLSQLQAQAIRITKYQMADAKGKLGVAPSHQRPMPITLQPLPTVPPTSQEPTTNNSLQATSPHPSTQKRYHTRQIARNLSAQTEVSFN